MAGKPKINGRSDSRGNPKGKGRPKGIIETQPRKPKVSKPDILPTEEIRKRWRAAAKKFETEFGNTPEFYMLRLTTDPQVPTGQRLAIFREYVKAFGEPVSTRAPQINIPITQNVANFGSPELLEDHPGAAVALPKLKSDMEPADVIDIKSKEITDGD